MVRFSLKGVTVKQDKPVKAVRLVIAQRCRQRDDFQTMRNDSPLRRILLAGSYALDVVAGKGAKVPGPLARSDVPAIVALF